jgi:hypothetical protein
LRSLKASQELRIFTEWGWQPYAQPGGPGYPFVSGSSPLTCPAWRSYQLLRYRRHGSHDNESPIVTSK